MTLPANMLVYVVRAAPLEFLSVSREYDRLAKHFIERTKITLEPRISVGVDISYIRFTRIGWEDYYSVQYPNSCMLYNYWHTKKCWKISQWSRANVELYSKEVYCEFDEPLEVLAAGGVSSRDIRILARAMELCGS